MGAKSLAIWAGGGTRGVSERHAAGAGVVAWPGSDTTPLGRAGVPHVRAEDVLGDEGTAAIAAAARSWARVWARLPLSEGRGLRELATWREQSLVFTCEGFLREATAGPRCASTAELCLQLLSARKPTEVDVFGLAATETVLLSRAATALGVLFHGTVPRGASLSPAAPPVSHGGRLGRLLSLLRFRTQTFPGANGGHGLLALVDDSAQAAELAPLLRAACAQTDMPLGLAALGELERFESRRSRSATGEAVRQLRTLHVALRGTPALVASYVHRGVGFADLARSDIDWLLLDRLPRTVRRLECLRQTLESVRPSLVLVAVGSRDDRRTLGMAATDAGVPWVVGRGASGEGEEPERADGGPHPAAVLALDAAQDPAALAARLLAVRDAGGRS